MNSTSHQCKQSVSESAVSEPVTGQSGKFAAAIPHSGTVVLLLSTSQVAWLCMFHCAHEARPFLISFPFLFLFLWFLLADDRSFFKKLSDSLFGRRNCDDRINYFTALISVVLWLIAALIMTAVSYALATPHWGSLAPVLKPLFLPASRTSMSSNTSDAPTNCSVFGDAFDAFCRGEVVPASSSPPNNASDGAASPASSGVPQPAASQVPNQPVQSSASAPPPPPVFGSRRCDLPVIILWFRLQHPVLSIILPHPRDPLTRSDVVYNDTHPI